MLTYKFKYLDDAKALVLLAMANDFEVTYVPSMNSSSAYEEVVFSVSAKYNEPSRLFNLLSENSIVHSFDEFASCLVS